MATSAVFVSAAERPNVLLIVADDLGYSDLGCYGGEIETPHLDALAAGGVRLTQFHTTARCCPSRASLLTGHYPHRVNLGHMTTNDIGRPGYRGVVASWAPTIAQTLNGYRSFLSGKWHLGTDDPTKHGFERFYGTLVSAKTFWVRDHFREIPAADPVQTSEPFYGTDALTDRAIQFLQMAQSDPDPWFLYLAYNAPHFPLHAPKEAIDKYRDRYHGGWDQLRAERLEKMKAIGLVPRNTELSERSPYWNYGETKTGVNPDWESLPEDRRQDLARRMAIYAAMVDRMDQGIGRVVASLRERGELDNTLILFFSDNGACAEWDPHGFDIKSSNQNILHVGAKLDEMGQPGTFHSAGSGWANASNTPFRLYKHFCHQGGVLSPCIVHWPAKLKAMAGSLHAAPAHVIDVMPTVLEASGDVYPEQHNGESTHALPGVSLLGQLDEATDRTIFLEHEGNRGVRSGRWKLVALKGRPWELYNLTKDPIESTDLAAEYPIVAKRLETKWDRWAKQNQVTPLPDDYGVKYLKPRP